MLPAEVNQAGLMEKPLSKLGQFQELGIHSNRWEQGRKGGSHSLSPVKPAPKASSPSSL